MFAVMFIMIVIVAFGAVSSQVMINTFFTFLQTSASEKVKGLIFGLIISAVLVGIIVGYAFLSNVTINPYWKGFYMRTDAIMMALFMIDNDKTIKKIENNRIFFTDGTVKHLKEYIKQYKELFGSNNND